MHVTFISQCEKRAIKRTRSVLDSYANRVGNFTWITPITTETLTEIHVAIKRKATRQTAVACYQNDGIKRMKLLWTVGRTKQFGRNGEIAIATRKHQTSFIFPSWLNDAITVAGLSGLSHDFGKSSKEFAHKITPENAGVPTADPIRHDLISAVILKKMLSGISWNDAWNNADYIAANSRIVARNKNNGIVLSDTIKTIDDSILFCVATHHRLFVKGTAESHVNKNVSKDGWKITKAEKTGCCCDADIEKLSAKVVTRVNAISSDKPVSIEYWTGVSLLARAALILADHKVSSDKSHPYNGDNDAILFANTTKNSDGKMIYNQTLANHLAQVSNEAARMVKSMATNEFPSLQPESVDRLIARSTNARYEWQNIAANCLTPNTPTLVLNIASTGAGKTRMNLRAAAVLAGDKPLRITTALNLRTLTLQTGDAYKELGINDDEMSVIIGSSTAIKLHEYENCGSESEEADSEVILDKDRLFAAPEWLDLKNNISTTNVLMSPVLVSTVDYVINAGDLRKQATHGIALLRMMHSDLIIDEIDGYEPKSLASVLRLVRLSAMFGKNVIVSSGTMPDVVARYVWSSYHAGRKIYNAMNETDKPFECIIFDDSSNPSITTTIDVEQFDAVYSRHVTNMIEVSACKPVSKKAEIIKFERGEANLFDAIKRTVDTMHTRHAWGNDNGKLSIGLVRVANINRAIDVAKMLDSEKNTFVCCYHSRHFMIQRYHIEKRLDELLNRKDGDDHILNDDEIRSCIEKSEGRNARIIVVATPVEEVGRDHDFDWSIIEPSSTQSIVQTAGRVNRHRQCQVTEPNIAILRYNFNESNRKGVQPVFARPGYENCDNGSSTHLSHDVCELIDEKKINERLDANLRFDVKSHRFSEYDTKSIESSLKKLVDPVLKNDSQWMDSNFYAESTLRDNDDMDSWYLDKDDNWYKNDFIVQNGRFVSVPVECNARWTFQDKNNELFVLSLKEMRQLADDIGITYDKAFDVRVYPDSQNEQSTSSIKYSMTMFGVIKKV